MSRSVKAMVLRVAVVAGALVAGWIAAILFAGAASAEEKPVHVHTPPDRTTLLALVSTALEPTKPLLESVFTPQPSEAPLVVAPAPSAGDRESIAGGYRNEVTAPAVVSIKPKPAPAPPKAVVVVDVPVAAPAVPAPVVQPPAERPRPQHKPVARPAFAPAQPASTLVDSTSDANADRGNPGRPSAPAAPAAPTASSAADGGGHARGGLTGMPAGRTGLQPPTSSGVTGARVSDAHGRPAGLPASSPD